MDLSDFYATFFEEADELLADMEGHLLALDPAAPDPEQLNAIFRAAHSIKGGAGTFGFDILQRTTHIFENLLDHTRQGELALRAEIIDTFLETKDMLNDQLDAYRNGTAPDAEAYERICQTLQKIAEEELGRQPETASDTAQQTLDTSAPDKVPQAAADNDPCLTESEAGLLLVTLVELDDKDRDLLVEELSQLGEVVERRGSDQRHEVVLRSSVSAEDIEAVMCFIASADQIEIRDLTEPQSPPADTSPTPESGPAATPPDTPPTAGTATTAKAAPELKAVATPASPRPGKVAPRENSSIRVSVDKVDQIINLVGELIITQSMLDQTVSEMEGNSHPGLLSGMSLLQRNARDLQEAVMSVRMVPMDYVFSRFPRLVRDLAGKLGKQIELVTEGESTELDKSLTERIIDPLTHLVRNSLDHGIELPGARTAVGKPATGRLTLSAQHQGGNILIEVMDDGAGLNRERILAKASESGLNVSDAMSDEEVWQLIFAPGFSTAAEISDVSGRGVGMDVVKRNIQAMGGHVEILSRPGQGTTTRIVLPLTLAILDGMSVKVGAEMFILPLSAVIESMQPTRQDLYTMAGDDLMLRVREEYLPVVALHEALEVANACHQPTESIAVIVQGEGRRYALLVDDLVGQQQVVVKNLETNYRRVPGVAAATILGDGSVALILDIADLHRLHQRKRRDACSALTDSATQLAPQSSHTTEASTTTAEDMTP
ncbi:chemotaxis protein CheA [Halomonas cupida]|uniref:Chemotaxis protein CheA n=1 Tax=Halomonas cupida TaxID=44933 RepID=A0A1M7G6Q4_9GAMM|nr:chemotaxis protein CheA [Halomonas cupida]GEN23662.1 chemotaxis protein CheA [Halomonas cupida]SHM11617.1 CheA signal transduction histidine kinase [Halomonas cupida]